MTPTGGRPDSPAGPGSPGAAPLDLNSLFLRWKAGSGEEQRLAAAVKERQQHVKDLKSSLKVIGRQLLRLQTGVFAVVRLTAITITRHQSQEAAARVNTAKAAIDDLARQEKAEKAAGAAGAAAGEAAPEQAGAERGEVARQLKAAKTK